MEKIKYYYINQDTFERDENEIMLMFIEELYKIEFDLISEDKACSYLETYHYNKFHKNILVETFEIL